MSPIICTVDVVLLTIKGGALHVALLKREQQPFDGILALPGAFIRTDEDRDAEEAAARMLKAKTGVTSPYLEQLATFSGHARDPRGWSLSVAYYALVSEELITEMALPAVHLVPVDRLRGLPFDHNRVVAAAVERVRSKSTYSSLPVYLLNSQFTLPQLQAVYEAVLGELINKVSFRRKMDELAMVEPIEGAFERGKANRPAQLYRLKKAFSRKLSVTDRGLNSG